MLVVTGASTRQSVSQWVCLPVGVQRFSPLPSCTDHLPFSLLAKGNQEIFTHWMELITHLHLVSRF